MSGMSVVDPDRPIARLKWQMNENMGISLHITARERKISLDPPLGEKVLNFKKRWHNCIQHNIIHNIWLWNISCTKSRSSSPEEFSS